MRTIYVWRFVFTVAFPMFVASVAVAWLTVDLIDRVSTGANTADHQRTEEIIQSALNATQLQIANTTVDNATWDDAVRHTYGEPDPDWVEETWGAPSTDGINYDVMLIVDRGMTDVVAGYRKGSAFKPAAGEYFLHKLDKLLALLPQDSTTAASKAAIMNTTDGLAVVGAAPIVPTSSDVAIPAATPRYLVYLKFLTPDYVSAIGDQYVIKDLKIVAAVGSANSESIVKDMAGDPLARIAWTDRQPGEAARASVMKKAVPVLSFLGIVMAAIGFICWRLIRTIAGKENAARHEALHDNLTGLPNRAALQAELGRLSKPGSGLLAVAFLDLDGFKEVNDTYDHETGDRLIKAVAAGFLHLVGTQGKLFRLGGDEFVILVCGPSAEKQAATLSGMVIDFLANSFDLDGRMVTVGASIGIAAAADGDASGHELMRRADIAMYRAKSSGKNRYCLYAPQIDSERNDEISIANELRSILASGTIGIAYQPIVDAQTRNIVAVEALARWPASSPRRITPDRFVAVAESQGLIDALGDAILKKACTDASQWPHIRLSVNISPVQLRNPGFADRTLRTVSESGIAIGRLELEVTEGSLVTDIDGAKMAFDKLRRAGVHIALDDFGTGFSSIGYLRQFSFDRIKIDRSLVNQVLNGSSDQNIVQGAMLMANGLAATVTVEGVEREDQVDILRLSGCDEMQGFYFFRPMNASEISKALLTDQSCNRLPQLESA